MTTPPKLDRKAVVAINKRAANAPLPIPESVREFFRCDPETGVLYRTKTGKGKRLGPIGCLNVHGYLTVTHEHKTYLVHRLVWFFTHDEQPPDIIDHINGDGTDNRPINLRAANNSQNLANSRTFVNNTSGFRGVFWNKQPRRWQARITVMGKHLHLGTFDTPEEGAAAYAKAALEYNGEYSRAAFHQSEKQKLRNVARKAGK